MHYLRQKWKYWGKSMVFVNSPYVMVGAWSHSFWRTIIGWLQQSLRWWLTHHCSVPPLPPATVVGLISELHQNTSSTPLPPTKPAFLSFPLPTSTMCYLPQHNQSPTMLHTCSMFQANHIVHAPVLEVMGLGHHKDLRGFKSAPFGVGYPHYMFILLPYAFQVNSLYVHVSPLYKYSSLLYVFR